MVNNKVIRLSKSCIGNEEKKAVLDVLEKEYLGMGEEVLKFEKELKLFFGREVVCVVNGTAALQLALEACGIGDEDEVLVPSFTYLASFQAISATGAIPIPCDVDAKTFLIDINDIKKRITNKTKAIMPVHYTGGVSNLKDIYEVANELNLRVIEDAAHSFGSTYESKKIGSFGDISCFSFDGIKNITSGEGGCIVSSDKIVLDKIKDLRLLGVEKDSENRYQGKRTWNFDVKNQGWRYHMSNIMASIGIQQLKKFDVFALKRKSLAKRYDDLLSNVNRIATLDRDYKIVVPHIYVIRIIDLKDREKLRSKLLNNNIETGIHYLPNHLLSLYEKNTRGIPLPITEKLHTEILIFLYLLNL